MHQIITGSAARHNSGVSHNFRADCTISLGFLGIFLSVLRNEVTVRNVYITNQFQTAFAGGGGVKYIRRGDCE